MKSVPEILKKRREELGLSVEEISQKIKIHKKYLVALEDNDSKVFDSKVIARGFLIKYCRYLGLNDQKIVAFWRRDFDLQIQKKPKKIDLLDKLYFSPRFFLILGFLFTVFVIVSFSFFQYFQLKKPPKININEPVDGLSVKNDNVVLKGSVSKNAELFLNNKKINITSDGEFTEKIYLTKGFNKLLVKAVSPYGIEVDKIITVYADIEVAALSAKSNELYVKSIGLNPTFIEVKDLDKQIFSGYLMPGVEKTFSGENLFFYTDTVENVSIKYNGVTVDTKEKEAGIFTKNF